MMRKILGILLIVLFCYGCNLDDGDGNQFVFHVLPVESIELPQSFTLNETYEIPFTFYRPTNCHGYNGVISNPNDNERTIAVSAFSVEGDCVDFVAPDGLSEQSFNFVVNHNYTYIFKVWKGKDEQGNDMYETIEVPVTD
ncbi:hypothetical protein [Pseudofulvibacter geojedonensis]|uniref:DUF4625 domain-containing protein n=1 Tax=Pseudofulvibacter geojedonensis TaxID=1123758 RepID=A0ABW3I0B4_9FLAO